MGTIAFPAISCGVFGYPPKEATRIAIAACRAALEENALLKEIVLVAFDQRMASLLADTLRGDA